MSPPFCVGVMRSLSRSRFSKAQVRLTFGLGSAAGFQVVLGLVYQWYLLTRLGPGTATDALFAGMMVPQLILAVAGGPLTYVLVPLMSVEQSESAEIAWTFAQSVALVFGILVVLLASTAHQWVRWTVPGFEPLVVDLTVRLARIQLIGVLFAALVSVPSGLYLARQRYLWAELSSSIAAVIGLGVLVLGFPAFGVFAAAWAAVVRSAFQGVLLLPAMGPYRKPQWKAEVLAEAGKRIRPLLLGSMYYKSDRFLDRFLATMAPAGSLSLLHLSQQVYVMGHSVLNKAIVAPMIPELAGRSRRREWLEFRRISRDRLLIMAAVAGGAFLFLVFWGTPLLEFFFQRGRFDSSEVRTLWWLLLGLGGVWIGGAVGQVLSSSFYAKGDTVTPTRIGVFGFTLAIVLKVVGFLTFGIAGLVVAASAYYLLNGLISEVLLERQLRGHLSSVSADEVPVGS